MVIWPSTQAGQGLVTVPTGHSGKPHNFRRPGAQSSHHSRLSSVGKIWILHWKDGCESWTIRKAEYWRIDAFELWCWRRFLRVPWTTRKTVALTRRTFSGKVMSLLFNMLSRLVIAFLPRSKRLLISWLQSPSAVILEALKTVCYCFPIYLPRGDGTRCHDLSFLNVEL